jgi:peptide/nickel transport system substrate-binding protein
VPNPVADVQRFLPGSVFNGNYAQFEDAGEVALYDKMLRETDVARQRALMREFEKYVVDTEAHDIWVVWWYRGVPYRSYVKGWKISPSHFINQDLATVWLDR